jgi:hypothetical protein
MAITPRTRGALRKVREKQRPRRIAESISGIAKTLIGIQERRQSVAQDEAELMVKLGKLSVSQIQAEVAKGNLDTRLAEYMQGILEHEDLVLHRGETLEHKRDVLEARKEGTFFKETKPTVTKERRTLNEFEQDLNSGRLGFLVTDFVQKLSTKGAGGDQFGFEDAFLETIEDVWVDSQQQSRFDNVGDQALAKWAFINYVLDHAADLNLHIPRHAATTIRGRASEAPGAIPLPLADPTRRLELESGFVGRTGARR